MDSKKLRKLKKLGGRVTTVEDLLGLGPEEMAVIEARLTLARAVKAGRTEAGLTQAQLAKRIRSSQARIAKMEGGDPQASIESMIRALTAAGSTLKLTIRRAGRRSSSHRAAG